MTYMKYAASICFILAMASELIGFIWLHRLHVAAGNPKTLNHQLLKQIFLRFTNCAKLNIQISNTPAFVARYLSHYTRFGIHYTFFEKLGFAFAISGISITTYGTFRYTDLFTKYALMAVLVAIVYAFFCSLLDMKEKQQQIVILITDYLDNTLSHRLASRFAANSQPTVQPQPAMQNQSPMQPSADGSAALSHSQPANPVKFDDSASQVKESAVSSDEEIIFSVINDFLI